MATPTRRPISRNSVLRNRNVRNLKNCSKVGTVLEERKAGKFKELFKLEEPEKEGTGVLFARSWFGGEFGTVLSSFLTPLPYPSFLLSSVAPFCLSSVHTSPVLACTRSEYVQLAQILELGEHFQMASSSGGRLSTRPQHSSGQGVRACLSD